jgi:hypothetical protein
MNLFDLSIKAGSSVGIFKIMHELSISLADAATG